MDVSNNLHEIEAWLLAVCRELGLPIGDPSDDFFDAGGTSITAVKLIARAEARFGEDSLPPDDLFTESTLHSIAKTIKRQTTEPASEPAP